MLFIAGLWPFNFTEKNNAVISPAGGLEIARHGTAYTALPAGKLQDLKQFAIYIDLATSSDGLSAFEKIFGYAINQEEMNFLLGQWKDGLVLHSRTEQKSRGSNSGSEEALKKDERTQCLISYDGVKLILYQDGQVKNYRETGPSDFQQLGQDVSAGGGYGCGGKVAVERTIYEAAIYDRALTSGEVRRLSGHVAEHRVENWEWVSGKQEQQAGKGEMPRSSTVAMTADSGSRQRQSTARRKDANNSKQQSKKIPLCPPQAAPRQWPVTSG